MSETTENVGKQQKTSETSELELVKIWYMTKLNSEKFKAEYEALDDADLEELVAKPTTQNMFHPAYSKNATLPKLVCKMSAVLLGLCRSL